MSEHLSISWSQLQSRRRCKETLGRRRETHVSSLGRSVVYFRSFSLTFKEDPAKVSILRRILRKWSKSCKQRSLVFKDQEKEGNCSRDPPKESSSFDSWIKRYIACEIFFDKMSLQRRWAKKDFLLNISSPAVVFLTSESRKVSIIKRIVLRVLGIHCNLTARTLQVLSRAPPPVTYSFRNSSQEPQSSFAILFSGKLCLWRTRLINMSKDVMSTSNLRYEEVLHLLARLV